MGTIGDEIGHSAALDEGADRPNLPSPPLPSHLPREVDRLQDDDVLELHDLDGGEVLRRSRLRARLAAALPAISSSAASITAAPLSMVAHEDVVARAVDERDVAHDSNVHLPTLITPGEPL